MKSNEFVDKPRIRKYTYERPDGTTAVRYEVLDHLGRRVSGQGIEGYDDYKNAKAHLDRISEGQIYFQGGGGPQSQHYYKPRHVPNQDELENIDEDLRKWFKEKWVRFNPQGKIMGPCARGDDSEGKPKCLPQAKAHALGKKGRASAASRKRREDPNPERSGKAINVNTKKKSNEGVAEGEGFDQEAGIGIDGQSFKFKIKDLVDLAKSYPVTKVDPKQFANQIAGREEDPTQSAARAEKADLQYPIIVVKRANGQLWIADGTHRAHKAILNKLPSINAKIIPIKDMATFSTKQGVAEGSEDNKLTANKIFFARSNIAPKGWSYDHVGFITQDGKQIQMSGHKGNDVYVTNDVTDDPEFPEQKLKIVSLSKPVSVPTTNSVGAENCGTFVANVLQANGIKGIDTQKLYNIFKKPREQGVAEGFPQPGESSGKAKQFNPNAKIQTKEMTLDQVLNTIKGIPYVNNVIDDWDAKDYSWGVTKKVIEYAQYLQKNPQSVANLPPLVVIDGKLNDGAHRLSAINLLQKRMDPKNPLWKQVKLKVNFGTSADVASEQGVAEDKCPHCGGELVSEELINEKKDACYYKVKSRYKVWPSAYASGALVKCRKKGAKNWGKSKTNENLGIAYPGTYEQNQVVQKKLGRQNPQSIAFETKQIDEKWSEKYKRSINCNNPKGFSQRAHCQGRKKHK